MRRLFMSRAEVVVSTVGNSVGYLERHERSSPANVRVAAGVPVTALPAAAGDGPHRRGSLDPVPRSSKLTKVNWLCTDAGTKDARMGRMRTPLSPGPPGLNTITPLLLAAGCSMTDR